MGKEGSFLLPSRPCTGRSGCTRSQFPSARHNAARTGCSADQAFSAMADLSQRHNIKLRDVAHQLLEKDDECRSG
jgi:hypothetical protein